jgi:hypothetical protein
VTFTDLGKNACGSGYDFDFAVRRATRVGFDTVCGVSDDLQVNVHWCEVCVALARSHLLNTCGSGYGSGYDFDLAVRLTRQQECH